MNLDKLALITGSLSAVLFAIAGILKLVKKSKGLESQAPATEEEETSSLTG